MKNDPSSAVQAENRRLAAIMFTDIVGFSRQMGSNEARTLRLLETHNRIIQQAVAAHHGTVIKTVGDAFLVDFPSVVNAVQGAQQIQAQFQTHNADTVPPDQIHVRIGIHSGDIVQKNGDVFGDGVNIASRLQALAEPDTICISDAVHRDVAKKLDLGTVVSLGRPKLKNIAERFQVYALLPAQPKGFRQTLQVHRLKFSRRVHPVYWLSIAGLSLIAGTILTVSYFSVLLPSTQPLAPSTQSLSLPDKPSIVILPFVNMSGDSEQEYFSDGITEDITSSLSKVSSLFVIARNSAFTYKGKAVKVQDVGHEMGVRYVLEGSVRKADTQVRITAQLIDATTGEHLWSERYDRPLKDIFALQDEIVQKIVFALKVKLTAEEQTRFRQAPTNNLDAYDFYLRGLEARWRGFYETKKELNDQARRMYEKAIELDPQYAAAYAGLGWTYFFDWFFRWNSDRAQTLERAFELGQRAVALDDFLSDPHQLLGRVYVWQKQHEQAIAEAERAIALDPNNADGYWNLGNILTFAGRPEEGIEVIEKGMRRNPRYPPNDLLQLGNAYRVAGRYKEALVPLKKVLTLNPNSAAARRTLAACYAEVGQLEEARAEMAEALRLNSNYSLEWVRQNTPYKDPADLERWIAALRKAGLK
jgi:adenylate cyclase